MICKIDPIKVIAKSDPVISLRQHVDNLFVVFKHLKKEGVYKTLFNKMSNVYSGNKLTFNNFLKNIIEHHDDGKGHLPWQNYIQKRIDGNKNIIRTMRHEYISGLMYEEFLSDEELLAIISHHGNFRSDINRSGYYYSRLIECKLKNSTDTAYKFLKRFNKLKDEITFGVRHFNDSKVNQAFLRYNAAKSLLRIVDKTASFLESHPIYSNNFSSYLNKFLLPFKSTKSRINFHLKTGNKTLRPIQQKILEHPIRPLTIIRAIPGIGKTIGAALWATNVIKENKADKLIFTLPTKFTTNQMTENLRSLFNPVDENNPNRFKKNLGTSKYHSDIKMQVKLGNEGKEKHESKESDFDFFMNKLIAYPINVRTLDSIINPFMLSKEEHYDTCMNIINSCIVIDEIDFYDDYPVAAIYAFLEKCRDWKIPVLIMSASFPKAHFSMYKEIYGEEFNPKIDYIHDNSHDHEIRYQIGDLRIMPLKLSNKIKPIFTQGIKQTLGKAINQDTIIFCNTTSSSYNLYEYYVDKLKIPKERVVLYNKLFAPPERERKENQIMSLLGENKLPRDHSIVVIMTQVGEMSLNISAPYMISEICPINRLYQRLGRLNRFTNKIGICDILIPVLQLNNGEESSFFYPYVDNWMGLDKNEKHQPSKYYTKTLNLLRKNGTNKLYSFKQLDDMVDEVFSEPITFDKLHPDAQHNIGAWHHSFNLNFLYGCDEEVDVEEENSHIFNMRGIRNITNIFIDIKDNYESQLEFDKDYFKFGILSLRDKLALNSIFETREVTIKSSGYYSSLYGDREPKISTVNLRVLKNPDLYNYDTGLNQALFKYKEKNEKKLEGIPS